MKSMALLEKSECVLIDQKPIRGAEIWHGVYHAVDDMVSRHVNLGLWNGSET